jgi:hypothetical protein
MAVRDVLGTLLAEGAHVTGYDRAGWYLVSRKTSQVVRSQAATAKGGGKA